MSPQSKLCSGEKNGWIWSLPVIVPFLTLFFAFLFGTWGWGLMDDLAILSYGTNMLERITGCFHATLQFGQYKPLYVLYTGVGYSIFEHAPQYFYVAKAVFALAVLFLWGFAAQTLTRKKVALFLVPSIALSFHYFYDVFFCDFSRG